MSTAFPGAIDTLTNPLSSDTLDGVPHDLQHANANDAIEAIETVIGITGSADTSSLVYKVAALQTGKANVSHTHPISDVTGLQTALDGKAALSHSHAISDVTGLQTALDGKAALSHSHAISDVTGLQTALDGKASTSHVHSAADITSGTLGLARGGTNASSFTANALVYATASALASTAALTYAASGTHLTITAQSATDVPLVIKGGASGNLREYRNSGNTLVGSVSPNGWTAFGHAAPAASPVDGRTTTGSPAGYFFATSDNGLECHCTGGASRAAGYFSADSTTTAAFIANMTAGTTWTTPLIKILAKTSVQTRDLAAIDGAWLDSTDASRKGRLYLAAYDSSALREGFRIDADGSAARIGFFGVTAVVKQTGGSATAGGTYGATEQSMLQTAYDALRSYGLLT